MDRRTLVAVALCVLFILFYQPLLRLAGLGRYLPSPRPLATDTTRAGAADTSQRTPPAGLAAQAPSSAPADLARPQPGPAVVAPLPATAAAGVMARSYDIETPLYRAVFTDRGARLLTVELKHYALARAVDGRQAPLRHLKRGETVPAGDRVVLAGGPLLGLDLGSGGSLHSLEPLAYAAEESTDAQGNTRVLTFTGRDSAGTMVRQTWRADPGTYALTLDVQVTGVPAAWRLSDYSLTMRSWPPFTEADRRTDERAIRATALVGTNLHRDAAAHLLKGAKVYEGNVEWAAVQSRYFIVSAAVQQAVARGVVSRAEERPVTGEALKSLDPRERPVQSVAVASLVSGLPPEERPVHRYLVYAGPSDYRQLAKLDHDLGRSVDLGWNWIRPISELLLKLLNAIFTLVRNYGVAILLLATLVRLLLYPLNAASLRSMRAMQKLQPEVDRLRDKYKNEPQAMNTALMALYKENKVNPAGGCLPILLQMPILMALYQVLLNAIELRQAPFVSWMNDLSAPDLLFSVNGFPVRLLPILMAGSGFLQQKLTPMNPQQAPTQYMMNIFMLVLFYNLPSGLVMYWTVMNLLTAGQQWMVIRRDEPVVVTTRLPAQKKSKSVGR